jgi:hypothetical protein
VGGPLIGFSCRPLAINAFSLLMFLYFWIFAP